MGFSPCEYTGLTRNQCEPLTLKRMIASCNVIQQPTTSNPFGGQISITIIGGTSPYKITWSDRSVNTPTRTGLSEGSYTATITDYYGDFTTTVTCSLVEEYSCVCPPGFEVINDECVSIIPASKGAISPTGYTGSNPYVNPGSCTGVLGTQNANYGFYGVLFYEEITNKKLPLTFFNNCVVGTGLSPSGGCAVSLGEYSRLVDATNWAPSQVSSYFGYYDVNISGTPVTIVASATNTNDLWTSSGLTTYGRMNLSGILGYYNNPCANLNQWVGISVCLNNLPSGLYHLFVGGDDVFSLEWNNQWLIKRCNNKDDSNIFNDGSSDKRFGSNSQNIFFQYNHVLPITLSGDNIFNFYWSDVGKQPTNGVFEIYSGVTTFQLTAFTTTGQLDPYIIFSTSAYSQTGIVRNLISPPCGSDTPNYGYYCTNGYQLFSACTTPVCKITIPCSNDLT
jgi:hypothetical protein